MRLGLVLCACLAVGAYTLTRARTDDDNLRQRLESATILSVAAGYYAAQTGHYPSQEGWETELKPILGLMAEQAGDRARDPLLELPFPRSQPALKRLIEQRFGDQFALCPAMDRKPTEAAHSHDVLFYEVDGRGAPLRRSGRVVVAYAAGSGAEAIKRFSPRLELQPQTPTALEERTSSAGLVGS